VVVTIGVTGHGAAPDPSALDAALGGVRSQLELAFPDVWTVVSGCGAAVERAAVRCLLDRPSSRLVAVVPVGEPPGVDDAAEQRAMAARADEVIELPGSARPVPLAMTRLLVDLADLVVVLGPTGPDADGALEVVRDRGTPLVWLDVEDGSLPVFERIPRPHVPASSTALGADEVLAVLRSKFPRSAPETLQQLLERGSVRQHPDEEVLCKQGEQEDQYAVVISGEVEVLISQEDRRRTVASLPAGASLGGLEYLTGTPRIADVVATGPVVLLSLSFADVDEIVRSDPEVLRSISTEVITELLTSQSTFMALLGSEATAPAEHEVFISYARADLYFAKRLATGLRRFGVTTWLDVHNIRPGLSWARQVGEALDDCSAMVLVISPASMSSENSDDEWNYFLDKGHPIIPVLLEEAPRPYRLNKLQYIDFTSTPFDTALTKLVVAVRNTRPPAD
jgi:CRP-like cAMP-binding protein